jgi:hypothetical protein
MLLHEFEDTLLTQFLLFLLSFSTNRMEWDRYSLYEVLSFLEKAWDRLQKLESVTTAIGGLLRFNSWTMKMLLSTRFHVPFPTEQI